MLYRYFSIIRPLSSVYSQGDKEREEKGAVSHKSIQEWIPPTDTSESFKNIEQKTCWFLQQDFDVTKVKIHLRLLTTMYAGAF